MRSAIAYVRSSLFSFVVHHGPTPTAGGPKKEEDHTVSLKCNWRLTLPTISHLYILLLCKRNFSAYRYRSSVVVWASCLFDSLSFGSTHSDLLLTKRNTLRIWKWPIAFDWTVRWLNTLLNFAWILLLRLVTLNLLVGTSIFRNKFQLLMLKLLIGQNRRWITSVELKSIFDAGWIENARFLFLYLLSRTCVIGKPWKLGRPCVFGRAEIWIDIMIIVVDLTAQYSNTAKIDNSLNNNRLL